MEKYKPLNRHILIEVDKREIEQAESGRVNLDNQKLRPSTGTILKISDDIDKIEFKVGKKIIFNEFSGVKVPHKIKNLLVLSIESVLLIEEGDNDNE